MDPFHDPMDDQSAQDNDIFAGDAAEPAAAAPAGGDSYEEEDIFGGQPTKTADDEAPVHAAPDDAAATGGSEDPFAEPFDGAAPPAAATAAGSSSEAIVVSSPQDDMETKDEEDTGLPDLESPLVKWEQERKSVLEKRVADALNAKAAAKAKGKKDIADFNAQRLEVLQKTQASNRIEEKNHRADMESLMKHGTEWEKVAKLVNLQAKSNETRNVDRLRKLLIQLKNDKDNSMFKSSK